MVTAVTLNPCIDRTVNLEKLLPGEHNTALSSRCDVSGKGINVNLVLKALGVENRCLGLEHSESGSAVRELLDQQGIDFCAVPVKGTLRVNLKLTEQERMTEINEAGAPVDAGVCQCVMEALNECLPSTDRVDNRSLLENRFVKGVFS